MITPAFVLFLIADFTSFTYCHENSRGPYELQCIQFDQDAKGEVKFKRREADTVTVPIQLSPPARERFLAVLAGTNYLDHPETFESGKKIADLGAKHVTLDMAGTKREATFNYSLRKDVAELQTFFEGLINQETLVFDLQNAMKFEKLSIPKRLERLETEIKANRISDQERLIPLLDKIETDQQIMNYARTEAGKIKKEIQAGKK
jgi:hypothetical protein